MKDETFEYIFLKCFLNEKNLFSKNEYYSSNSSNI